MPAHPALPKPVRLIESEDVSCPAGEAVGGDAVFCGIEEGVLQAHLNPSSVERFCCGEYDRCPTWRAMKHAEWRRRGKHHLLPQAA